MVMRFGTWNVRNFCRAGSLVTVLKKLSKYKLDLVGMQEVRWEGGWHQTGRRIQIFYGKGNENYELGTGFFLCIRESYQHVRGLSLLVIGCRT
jgi:exonuclease III